MAYECDYKDAFVSDLQALDKAIQEAVRNKMRKIEENPERFKFLHKAKRIQKARVGKWRIVFRVEGNKITFYRIGKRDSVYGNILSQLLGQLS